MSTLPAESTPWRQRGKCAVGQWLKFSENFNGLAGQRKDLLSADRHSFTGNAPFGLFQVDFRPLRLAQLTRPDKY